MAKILLIAGAAKSGKDLVAEYIQDNLEAHNKRTLILHFADYLKSLATQLYAWDGLKDEHGRTLLQWLGTDVIRARNPNFWVETVARLIDVLNPDYDYFIISDCRFENEVNYWKDTGIETRSIKIIRENYTNNLTEAQKNHPSEHALDNHVFDYVLHTGEGKDVVKMMVDKFVEENIL